MSNRDFDALVAAVHEAMERGFRGRLLSDKQVAWVELAIEREAQSIAFRRAVIEKTLTGLLWAGIAGGGALVMAYLRAHGWKD
jgi:hypothetical protein